MSSPFTTDLIRRLPKTDLHLHLDGSLRLETLIELARERSVELPSYTRDGLLELVFKEKYESLPDYLRGFAYTCGVLTDAEALERVACELAEDCLEEGVRYIEVRFAPQLHTRDGFEIGEVLEAVNRGLRRAQQEHEASEAVRTMKEPPFRYGIVCCAMRMFTAAFSPYYDKLTKVLAPSPTKHLYSVASLSLARAAVEVRDRLGVPVVGFDLAGAEDGHPASDHVEAFQFAHRNFLKKTVHAGEAYGPESIFQAITSLHADRIGHGTHLYAVEQVEEPEPERYVERLIEYISDRRITLEVCITSNLQTRPDLVSVADHPFGRMIKDRLSVSLCTDNRLMSRTSVTSEIQQACETFDISPADLRNIVIYGFKRSFFPGSYVDKRLYVRQIIDYYDRVIDESGLPG